MPRNLNPELIAFVNPLTRGAFVVLREAESTGQAGDAAASAGPTPSALRFQYNPETVTRARTGKWEFKRNRRQRISAEQRELLSRHRGGGLYAQSETISFKIVFDSTEMSLRSDQTSESARGILPELAFLERIALSNERESEQQGRRRSQRPLFPVPVQELLLVLGERNFPVIITSVTITEQRFSPLLVPVRAEVDLKCRVLDAAELKGNQATQRAFEALVAQRATDAASADSSGQADLQPVIANFTRPAEQEGEA